jgi:inositol-phosphate phosphatase/L-galactose 1-phosphate phosphatase/histidinol-phosphatase
MMVGVEINRYPQLMDKNHSNTLGMDVDELQTFLTFADQLANQARPATLHYFRQKPETEIKQDGSPVTIADRKCELLIRKLIAQEYPNHCIRGEEFQTTGTNDNYTWVIDPIDGTKSFIAGAPTYGTLLALLYRGSPVLGVIDIPSLGERWSATALTPTTMNGEPIETQTNSQISKSILTVISPDRFDQSHRERLENLCLRAGVCRYSSDGYSYGLLASGHIGVVVAANQEPFDYLPVVNVIEQAGGCITDWKGNALGLESDGNIIASANQFLHEQALDICKI